MNHTPMISIAMATYNGERYLKEQLDSIFSQTWKNIELIICDDGSSDHTVEILTSYQEKYPLKLFSNEKNLGYCRNFEKAISLCSGEFIALADQDDIWEPTKLETLLLEIGSHDAICSDASLINEKGSILANSFFTYSKTKIPATFHESCIENFVTGCTTMITAEFARHILPFPPQIVHHDFWIGVVAMRKNGIIVCQKSLVQYRQHGNNQLGAQKRISAVTLLKDPKHAISRLIDLCKRWEYGWGTVNCSHYRAIKSFPPFNLKPREELFLDRMIAYAEQYEQNQINLIASIRMALQCTQLPFKYRRKEVKRIFLFALYLINQNLPKKKSH